MNDVIGAAIGDYYYNGTSKKLWIHNKYGRKEEMPLEIYFRNWQRMPMLERKALQACSGTVLDIGAGAGSHSLILQQRGFDVTALDISPKAVEVMQKRGVQQTLCADIFTLKDRSFDTLLLLMNGIGLTGSLQGLRSFLHTATTLLKRGGQLLFDSSDVAYLYKGKELPAERYYGEIDFQYEYKQEKTGWFSWLYIDQSSLTKLAGDEGWKTEVMYQDHYDQYLARLTRRK